MNLFKEKIIWLTGASSGIGFALLEELSKFNSKIIITSSNSSKLENAAELCKANGSEYHIVQCDLSNNEEVEMATEKALSIYGKIDILILNAGKSVRGEVHETSIKVHRDIMELDYFSNIIITKKVLESMKQNGGGKIAVTSSITGKFGFPLRSAYSAAKHALHGYFETLSIEERKNNINVTIVCPGRINTPISVSALLPNGEAYNKSDKGQEEGMPAEECAKKYLKAIVKGKREVLIGNKEILMVYFKRFVPSLFYKLAEKVKPT